MLDRSRVVSLSAVASQDFRILLNNQFCRIKIYQKDESVFCDLYVDDVAIWTGTKAITGTGIKPVAHLAFAGDLIFRDLNGNRNPHFSGFSTRWFLEYVI
jgi:hypothetical protein